MAVTYFKLLMLLEESRAQLGSGSMPAAGTDMMDWLLERRATEHHAADAACEEFALNGVWPPIRTASVLAQVHLRLSSAVQLCRSLVQNPLPDGLEQRPLLRALLLDYWHARVQHLRDGNPGDHEVVLPGRPSAWNGWSGEIEGGFNITQAD